MLVFRTTLVSESVPASHPVPEYRWCLPGRRVCSRNEGAASPSAPACPTCSSSSSRPPRGWCRHGTFFLRERNMEMGSCGPDFLLKTCLVPTDILSSETGALGLLCRPVKGYYIPLTPSTSPCGLLGGLNMPPPRLQVGPRRGMPSEGSGLSVPESPMIFRLLDR